MNSDQQRKTVMSMPAIIKPVGYNLTLWRDIFPALSRKKYFRI